MTGEPDWLGQGGVLLPGWVRCANRTGQPERVLTGEQVQRLAEEDEP